MIPSHTKSFKILKPKTFWLKSEMNELPLSNNVLFINPVLLLISSSNKRFYRNRRKDDFYLDRPLLMFLGTTFPTYAVN